MAKTKTADRPQFAVQRRQATGTRTVRRLRQAGVIPGVVYGKETKPVPVSVSHRALVQLLHTKSGEHALVTLRIEADGKPWEKPALVTQVQHDPVDGHVLHVDFHAILLTEEIKVKVPVVLKGEPIGVKEDGGILEHFLREVEVECLPTEIPEQLEFEVSALKIGDTIHVRDLTLPGKAKVVTDLEGAVASVQEPKKEAEPAEEAAVAEPEVIGEKKDEGEAEGGEPAKGGEPEGKKDAGKKEAGGKDKGAEK